jgi:hypothetical protein
MPAGASTKIGADHTKVYRRQSNLQAIFPSGLSDPTNVQWFRPVARN